MKAAVIRPFHWHDEFYVMELPVRDGDVQRDPDEAVTKFAIVDRFSGEGKVAKMFWRGCGPRTGETALACSVAHDKHNIWAVGSSDAAMARAVNALAAIQGGWALVREGELVATVRYEIGGLMTCRPAEDLDAEMQASLCRSAQGGLDVRTDLPPALVSRLSRTPDVRDVDLRALDLGAGRAVRAGAAGLPQRADRRRASGGVVSEVSAAASGTLDRFFRLRERGSSVGREVVAGATTFAAMAYIIAVNPAIMSAAGMDRGELVIATALAAIFGSVMMGLVANLPLAVAPAMGSNVIFTFVLVKQMGVPWQGALAMVAFTGAVFLVLSLSRLRERVARDVPETLKIGIQAGRGHADRVHRAAQRRLRGGEPSPPTSPWGRSAARRCC